MSGKVIYIAISALLGILSIVEGIWFFLLFLLYLSLLLSIKKASSLFLISNCIVFVVFIISSIFTVNQNKTILSPSFSKFMIQFTDEITIDGDKLKAVVTEVRSNEKLILTYQIATEEEKFNLQRKLLFNQVCLTKGKLELPSVARNENAFNYRSYLARNSIFWEYRVSNIPFNTCTAGESSIINQMKLWRLKGLSLIEKNFSGNSAPIAAALIFGHQDWLSEEVMTAYQRLGVIHLISISGLHVALLVGLLFYLGIRIGLVRERLQWALIIVLPFYAILTGLTPAVNRSVLMTMILLLAGKSHLRRLRALDGLGLSFLFLIFWNPNIIYNIGFQLSYFVTCSLLLSLHIVSRYPSYFKQIIITSYISQASVLPVLLYFFFEIPLFSIVANIIFIPLYSFIFLPGFIILFIFQFLPVEFLSTPLSHLLAYFISISERAAFLLSSLNWSSLVTGRPTHFFMVLYAASILLAFLQWDRKRLSYMCLPWLVMCIHLISPSLTSSGEITIIDVGQGDSIFIKLPFNQGNYLMDTGGRITFNVDEWKEKKRAFEVGKDTLIPYLKSKGIKELDLLILTHADMDHMGGSLSLIENMRIKRILLPSIEGEKTMIEQRLLMAAKEKGIPITNVYEGFGWKVNRNQFNILAPSKNYEGEKNDGSIVLYADIGGIRWLFTGDLGTKGESQLIKSYPNIRIDVLKVGHHGSQTSTSMEFIQHYKPKYSIISVGEKNGFGHPHKEVIKILEEGGSKIFRTDLHGGITYKFKGRRGTFLTVIP
jgi:competence protein ComEC